MDYFKKYISDLFISRNFYFGIGVCVLMYIIAFFFSSLQIAAYFSFLAFLLFVVADYIILFLLPGEFVVKRLLPSRFSNGDVNPVSWVIRNKFNFFVKAVLIDEWPGQLEIRDQRWKISFQAGQQKKIRWNLRPVKRGEYEFGDIHLLVITPVNILCRRFTTPASASVACYPSFSRLNDYGVRSNAYIQNVAGNLRMRKIGQSMEFEQIKEYVAGDDFRTVNWKASARRGMLMINQYAEERAQQVYCIIDKGRLMKMPFRDMTLLDHAINAALVLSSVCLNKKDKTGLVTFSNQIDTLLAADNRPSQMGAIMDNLYKQQTDFLESDFELLYNTVRSRIRNRSLLILFTNFESVSGLRRQSDYIRSLARYHLVLVVFFENTELKSLIKMPANTLEQVYTKAIAGKFVYEKKLIVRELAKYGIAAMLSKPDELTIRAVNKYLELKMKSAL